MITRMAVASFHSLFRRPFLLLNNGSTRRLRVPGESKNFTLLIGYGKKSVISVQN